MTILITGATDGLGLALARHYRKQNRAVLAVGRRSYTDLDAPPFPPDRYLQIDLALADADLTLVRSLNALDAGPLDLVVHNAGTGFYGPAEEQKESDIEILVNLNFTAPIQLTRALTGRLQKSGGKVVFIGSVAASMPSPLYATYAATKRGLEGFARSLRVEARGKYRVQVIHPGAMRTGFHRKLEISRDEMDWANFPDVERIAIRIARAMDGNRKTVTIGPGNRLLAGMARKVPRLFDGAYGRRFQ